MNEFTPTAERRPYSVDTTARHSDEEILIADSRATLTPSQMVEQKLIGMLKASPLMVSQVQRRLKPGVR